MLLRNAFRTALPAVLLALSGNLSAQQWQGRVADAQTGEGISHARVVRNDLSGYILSDTAGFFRMPPGNRGFHLDVFAPGYQAYEMDAPADTLYFLVIQLEPERLELEEVDIISSLTRSKIPDDHRNITALDDDHLAERAANTLAEGLDAIPGVQSVTTGVGISKPMIRGMTGTRIKVLDRGIGQEGQQWGMDHGLEIDQLAVERVEVIKGASALEYGSDATSGVIRILPNRQPIPGWHGQVRGITRTNNALIGQSSALSWRGNHHYVRMRYSLQDFGDYRVPSDSFTYNGYVLSLSDGQMKNTAGTEQNAMAETGWNRGNWVIGTVLSRFHQKVGLFPGALAIPREFDISNPGPSRDVTVPYQQTTHDKLITNIRYGSGMNQFELDLGLQRNQREERSRPHSHGLVYVDPDNTLALGLDLRSADANGRWKRKTVEAVEWTAGFSVQYQESRRSGWEYLLPDYRAAEYGVYGMQSRKFGTWTWTAGLRIDGANLNVSGHLQPWYNQPDSLVERTPTFDRNWINWAGSTGLLWLPRAGRALQLNLARSFRVPNPAELASNGVHHGTFRHEAGDHMLNPEIGWQSEFNAHWEENNWSVRPSVFFNYFSNYIYLASAGRFSPLPDAGQIYEYRETSALYTGAELFAEYHPVESVHLTYSGEYVWNHNLNSGLPLPFTPPLSQVFGVEYTFSDYRLGIEGQLVGAQNRVDRNERDTPGYFLGHAFARAEWVWGEQGLSVSARLQNIANTAYMRHISRYRILNLPEQGRNLIVQIEYRF